jgi:hypothetical protein
MMKRWILAGLLFLSASVLMAQIPGLGPVELAYLGIVPSAGGNTVGIDADGDGVAECTFGVTGTDNIGGTLSCLSNDDAAGSFSILENIDNGTHSITVTAPESVTANRTVVLQDDVSPFDTAVANMVDSYDFCGQGAAAGATVYLQPNLSRGSTAEDIYPGSTACDAKDFATDAGANERPLAGATGSSAGILRPYTVTGLICQVVGGTDDAITMTLMDDTVSTTVTLNMTIAGGQALGKFEGKVAIGGGSRLSVEANADDDDLSAADYFCTLFVSFS